ncbi:MAG TPA: pitrilysin family protein [Holophagaceae bacterium]|nr:pitrilysin family protein [Holophagaceae bacterium]
MPLPLTRICRSALVATLVAAPALAQSLPAPVEKTLSNGMRLLMVERHDKPTIAVGWVARVGSANERPGITGIAHLFEHMMFKGTSTIGTRDIKRDRELNDAQDKLRVEIRKEESILRAKQLRGEIADMTDPKVRSAHHQQLVEEFEKLVKEQQDLLVKDEFSKVYSQAGGVGLNAFTNTDVTTYIQTIPSNKLELWTWMESDRLRDPVFREFYKERDVVFEERRMRTESTPTGKFQEAFAAMTWTAHPYHWPVIGWASDVASITREQANEFFATFYAPNNITAVLVGDFKADEAAALCERYFGRIPANPKGVPELITLEPKQLAEKRMYAEAETTPSVEIAWKGVPSGHADQYALDLLGEILSGRSGRLYKSLVLEKKLATDVRAGNRDRKYAGTFDATGTISGDHTPEEVEKAIYAEIEKIQKDGVTANELQKVKNQAQANNFRSLEDDFNLMVQLAVSDAITGYREFLAGPAKYDAVTTADVQRVAKAYLTKETRNVAIFTRKAGSAPSALDKELEVVPEEARGMVKAQLAQIEKATDAEKLKAGLARMEGQAGSVPAEQKPIFDLMMKKVRARIEQLAKESK